MHQAALPHLCLIFPATRDCHGCPLAIYPPVMYFAHITLTIEHVLARILSYACAHLQCRLNKEIFSKSFWRHLSGIISLACFPGDVALLVATSGQPRAQQEVEAPALNSH
jgi:hypothetical protein